MRNIKKLFYALLGEIIHLQIKWDLFTNENKFKRGEWLKYNWKAKIVIDTVVEGVGPRQFERYTLSGSNVEFTDGDRCSPFWVRRLYFWERPNNKTLE